MSGNGEQAPVLPRSDTAPSEYAGGDCAVITATGGQAINEAEAAIERCRTVMMLGGGITVDEEVRLKALAWRHGVLMMGPDCESAIVDGAPLGFANAVRRGNIGIVGASGTGLQQVSCLIDRAGLGISQAIGTGRRELDPAVGGSTTVHAVTKLAADTDTDVIALVALAPARAVAERVVAVASDLGKPVVIGFIGEDHGVPEAPSVRFAETLEDAAVQAVALAGGDAAKIASQPEAAPASAAMPPPGGFVRGLLSGHVLCSEASMLLRRRVGSVYSNRTLEYGDRLADPSVSRGHTLIDLSDRALSDARCHPRIDLGIRTARLSREACDPGVTVVLLDVMLGFGAHPDPADALAPAVRSAMAQASEAGRRLAVVGSVCGTPGDPQDLVRQEALLSDAGMRLAPSTAAAARMAGALVLGG